MTIPTDCRLQMASQGMQAQRVAIVALERLAKDAVPIAGIICRAEKPARQDYDQLVADVTLADGFVLGFRLGHWALNEDNVAVAASMLGGQIIRAVALRPRIEAILATASERAEALLGGTTARVGRLGLARFEVEGPLFVRDITVETEISCLDAALRPANRTFRHLQGRHLAQDLRRVAAEQTRRARQLERLDQRGALVEISAPAAAAVAALGLSVAEIARTLLDMTPDGNGMRATEMAQGQILILHDGIIQFVGDVGPTPNAASLIGDELRIFETISAERRAGLLGWSAGALFAHPALEASGRIARITIGEGVTDVRLRGVKRRSLTAADLEDRASA